MVPFTEFESTKKHFSGGIIIIIIGYNWCKHVYVLVHDEDVKAKAVIVNFEALFLFFVS